MYIHVLGNLNLNLIDGKWEMGNKTVGRCQEQTNLEE